MIRSLILAGAGAGKSQTIVNEALHAIKSDKKVLILTYTENNQLEILNKICKEKKYLPTQIEIKGWFSFLLDEIIRPYQNCIFEKRISGVFFNNSDPHKRKGRNIPGRAEIVSDKYNKLHYLTKSEERVYTAYISKLAFRIMMDSKMKPIKRMEEIYDFILIDEVQDLVGWDFDIIERICRSQSISICCVGDFRQTIYTTHIGTKLPKSNTEKINRFHRMGFEFKQQRINWRCIQSICDYSDKVHSSEAIYKNTTSKVRDVPENFREHNGVFAVSLENVPLYLEKYKPTILRVSKSTEKELCKGYSCLNFGASKGMEFDRVFVITTVKQKKFISGEHNIFNNDPSEKAKSSFYVALTRAKYSIGLLYEKEGKPLGIPFWTPQ